ncbi:MAG: Ig-like domain-containing protein [Planctomycetaceae bacterium]|nr:Ig-like domain-containing protein [Planctomycetaceae bacterium]
MNRMLWTIAAATFVVACLSGDFAAAQDINAMPPVVVQTVPQSGVKDVDPGETEIRITFSKPMANGSWSWSTAWQDSSPKTIGKPKYDRDQKTCVLKVKLEPNKTYGYWINNERFQGFRDRQNHPAVPYLLVFRTKGN